jgi:hypothetical protein
LKAFPGKFVVKCVKQAHVTQRKNGSQIDLNLFQEMGKSDDNWRGIMQIESLSKSLTQTLSAFIQEQNLELEGLKEQNCFMQQRG